MRVAILIFLFVGIGFAVEPSGDRALELYRKTDYTGAIAALKDREPDAHVLQLLGQCYFQLGEFRKSTDALEKAASMAPADSMIQTWLGRAWGERAETSFPLTAPAYARRARESFEKAVRLDPANTLALSDLVDFYIQAPGMMGGGIEKARDLIPTMVRHDPVGAHLAEARIDEEKKQYALAEAQFREAVHLAPENLNATLDLAKFLARRGRVVESDHTFEQAARLAPDSPLPLFARAESYVKTKRNPAEARDLLKRYIDAKGLTPDDPPRWEALRLLRKTEPGKAQ